MQALLQAYQAGQLRAEPVCVVSNRSQAPGLETARAMNIRAEFISFKDCKEGERKVIELAKSLNADFIVLAGFMRVISCLLIDAFQNRIINIHPSLLPSFPGLEAQQQAVDYGVRYSGCTTHFVTAGVDAGPIILQRLVEVEPEDSGDTLGARILEQEHPLLIETVNLMADDRLSVHGRIVRVS